MDSETITFTAKGQVIIPAALRRKFGMREGTKASVTATAEGILLRPITRHYIHSLRGSMKGCGILRALVERRRYERSAMACP